MFHLLLLAFGLLDVSSAAVALSPLPRSLDVVHPLSALQHNASLAASVLNHSGSKGSAHPRDLFGRQEEVCPPGFPIDCAVFCCELGTNCRPDIGGCCPVTATTCPGIPGCWETGAVCCDGGAWACKPGATCGTQAGQCCPAGAQTCGGTGCYESGAVCCDGWACKPGAQCGTTPNTCVAKPSLQNGANCGGTVHAADAIEAARQAAYEYLNSGQQIGKNNYPHQYNNIEGFPFTTPSPWYEFPLLASGAVFTATDAPDNDRVIIDAAGEFTGIITHTGAATRNGFVECEPLE